MQAPLLTPLSLPPHAADSAECSRTTRTAAAAAAAAVAALALASAALLLTALLLSASSPEDAGPPFASRAPSALLLRLPAALRGGDTRPLDDVRFYEPSVVPAGAVYRTAVSYQTTLNDGLWSAANSTRSEQTFIFPDHAVGMETVLNLTAPALCASSTVNFTNTGGVATLPTTSDPAVGLGMIHGLSWDECLASCCNMQNCTAFAWYITDNQGLLCQPYTAGYITGPQAWPQQHVLYAQGGLLTVEPARVDVIANGLRSGTWLGGAGTGGYELRADGTLHLSTIKGQSAASEPWHGVVRDFVLAVSVNGAAHVVRLRPFAGLPGVPQIAYSDRFPLARLQFLNLTLYAYGLISPGDLNTSNTPAVVFTLHAHNAAEAPMNITFMVLKGLALRNDWHQQSAPQHAAGALHGVNAPQNLTDCAAACVAQPGCYAWQWSAAASSCSLDTSGYAQGHNAAGLDSGNPGSFSYSAASDAVVFTTDTVPGATRLYNGLGAEGLFIPPVDAALDAACAVASGNSVETLLSALRAAAPAAELKALARGAADHLYAAAAVSVVALPASRTASLSVYHAWHYPTFYWFRDSFNGSDVGQRYSNSYGTVLDVAASIDLSRTAQRLLAWQSVYSGLPPLLQDAAFNLLNHVRSSMWLRSGEYRQWESVEFPDWGDSTNNDERHVPYFHTVPESMESQLRTWMRHAQNPDGSFYCVTISGPNDAQYGTGDPCDPAGPHPDDIAMMLVTAYEFLMMANHSALIHDIYPHLLRGLAYYAARYNSSRYHLPYQVHETYDAVAESAGVLGEGNLGTSLFNSLQYYTALLSMRQLALHQADHATVRDVDGMLRAANASIQTHLWQPDSAYYVGDTLQDNVLLLEPNGFPYRGCDNLHGQVLAYRLGFGDLLPRRQMQLHQQYVYTDLSTPWGLQFDNWSQQNWLMGDITHSSLLLRWNEAGAWSAAQQQIAYWRHTKKELTRNTAVINAANGQYMLLNYYGYALFFYHTLSAWSGQNISLPHRSLQFRPHHSAFDEAGRAVLPILLAGDQGSLTLNDSAATIVMAFLQRPLSFLRIAICGSEFTASEQRPFVLQLNSPLVLQLKRPCESRQTVSNVTSRQYCQLSAVETDEHAVWTLQPLPLSLPNMTLPQCQQYALRHHYCGYTFSYGASTCQPVPGSGCSILRNASVSAGKQALGSVHCDFSSVYTPPVLVNTSHSALHSNVTFGLNFAWLNSPAYTLLLPTASACEGQARLQQSCGWLFVTAYNGSAVGSCNPAVGSSCCVLNPYRYNCTAGPPLTSYGSATLGIFS